MPDAVHDGLQDLDDDVAAVVGLDGDGLGATLPRDLGRGAGVGRGHRVARGTFSARTLASS